MGFSTGGNSGTISGAGDVSLSNPANAQVLTYSSSVGKWENATATGGGSAALTSTVASMRPVYPTPGTGAYTLVWSDSFPLPNGSTTAAVDPTKWSYQIGTGAAYYNAGWGNSELETYTNSQTNTQITSNGLEIRLINQSANGYDGTGTWTSGKILTKGFFAAAYGKVQASIKVPYGKGAWPAFWMLGADFPQSVWPNCGEIDIMEIGKGGDFSTVNGTIHGPGYSGSLGPTNAYTNSALLSNAFHTYGVEWTPTQISWFIDSNTYATITRASIPQPADWVFDHPFFILLNVAVANGGFPGALDTSTFQTGTFNGTTSAYATMYVQNVQVYQKQ